MAQPRTTSVAAIDTVKEPHSISLKVLRLSRPTLTPQYPLPLSNHQTSGEATSISSAASLAYPSSAQSPFVLSPLLTLPPAFGNAYVGETFSCTLCANNELPVRGDFEDDPLKAGEARPPVSVTNLRIEAEMKTPTTTISLDVTLGSDQKPISDTITTGVTSVPGTSLQGVISHHLQLEGSHILAVTVSYAESTPTSGRVRSFRKLYQFVARPCLVVRTKITGLRHGGGQKKWALEAQLENVGEETIVLYNVGLDPKGWCKAQSLNWEIPVPPTPGTAVTNEKTAIVQEEQNPILAPSDVQQICFLISASADQEPETDPSGRIVMGILSIAWRGPMGNWGSLSTGWLGAKGQ